MWFIPSGESARTLTNRMSYRLFAFVAYRSGRRQQ